MDRELASPMDAVPGAEPSMQPGNSGRTSQASVSAALAAVNAALRDGVERVRFPGEDGGRSLGEMAQRDLDAALQLLTVRAQYITGSSGAAIALRRDGKNDMLCRASAGSNAPGLGTLLSTEFGLSGESVRTRRALRCDDAERDSRVNQEVCRQIGIASVMVMPVVHDDEVLGVFELFSGKTNAFGERDLSALRRLSEMVNTAVTLSRAAEGFSDRLRDQEVAHLEGEAAASSHSQDQVAEFEADFAEIPRHDATLLEPAVFEEPAVLEESQGVEEERTTAAGASPEAQAVPVSPPAQIPVKADENTQPDLESSAAPSKKPLLWSAALNLSGG